jgi:hypothetical protein
VRFINDSVDRGGTAAPDGHEWDGAGTPSPYGVWGAFGTISGDEPTTP